MPAPGDTEVVEETVEFRRVRTYSPAGYSEVIVYNGPQPVPVVPVEERLAILEVENAALRKALVRAAVVTDVQIDAERPVAAEAVRPSSTR